MSSPRATNPTGARRRAKEVRATPRRRTGPHPVLQQSSKRAVQLRQPFPFQDGLALRRSAECSEMRTRSE